MSLRYAIMTALIDDELSGYDLARSFDQSIGFFWRASHQQIYRELKLLSERKWVSGQAIAQAGKPDRITYALTPAGREALDEWVLEDDKRRMLETRDELYIKLYNLAPNNIESLQTCIHERREQMMQRLYLYERIRLRHYAEPDSLPLRRKGVFLALLGGISGGRQYLRWCDEALELLAKSQAELSETTESGADTA